MTTDDARGRAEREPIEATPEGLREVERAVEAIARAERAEPRDEFEAELAASAWANDPGVASVVAALDGLARAEGAEPDPGFEGRLVEACLAADDAPAPISIVARARPWRMALAAGVAMALLAGASYLASRPTGLGSGSTTAPLADATTLSPQAEESVLVAIFDDETSDAIDELLQDAAAFEATLGEEWARTGDDQPSTRLDRGVMGATKETM